MQLNIQFASKDEGLFANHVSNLIVEEFTCYGWIRSYRAITEIEKAALINAVEGITYTAKVGYWEGTGAELVKQALPDGQKAIVGASYIHNFFIVFGY